MLTQKQWKIQHLTERMGNIAINAASEAARRAAEHLTMVKEHAIVAEEMRIMTNKMMELTEQNIFGKLDDESFDKSMKDILIMTTYLALNSALVACKALEHKPMAVYAEETRNLSLELGELYGIKQQFIDIPVVSKKNRVIKDPFFMLRAISGKYIWCENAQYVNEIFMYNTDFVKDNRLIINNEMCNMDIPIIKLGDVHENAGLIIISNDSNPHMKYAILAEITINILHNSYVGVSQPSNSDIPVRECWIASDGSEMIFPDWEKLANTVQEM